MDAAEKVTDSLNQAAWKLKGIAGLFKADGSDEGRPLEKDESDGLYWLIRGIAEEIEENAELITEVKSAN